MKKLGASWTFLSAVLGGLVLATTAAAQPYADHKGTEFYAVFHHAFQPSGYAQANVRELHLTSDVPEQVVVEYPAVTPTTTFSVGTGPGVDTVVSLPSWVDAYHYTGYVDRAIHLTAHRNFDVRQLNARHHVADAATALPFDAMSTRYMLSGHPATLWQGPEIRASVFSIVAPCADTTVRVTPSVNLYASASAGDFNLDLSDIALGGPIAYIPVAHPAHVPFDITLQSGEVFQLAAHPFSASLDLWGGAFPSMVADFGDLEGTLIEADHPVGVMESHGCVQQFACDTIFMAPSPIAGWGTEVPIAILPYRFGVEARVVAAEDNTVVSINGAAVATLDAGEGEDLNFQGAFLGQTGPLFADSVISASKPILVTQFMGGGSAATPGTPDAVAGDPARVPLAPTSAYLTRHRFQTLSHVEINEHWAVIIAEDVDVGALLLDGVAIPANQYAPIGTSGYSVARVLLTPGVHTTQSPNGVHGVTVAGYGMWISYLYNAGTRYDAGDASTGHCKLLCGNGILDGFEQCDDGNIWSGDGCSSECEVEGESYCGNGILEPGEQCDDGNQLNGDGCDSQCMKKLCGNGVVDPGEQCDDGNFVNGDGCDSQCMKESLCGNGVLDPGEDCDDGNNLPLDGCDPNCMKEGGICGNGVLESGEQCDDGNVVAFDGCGPNCEEEVCGDGVLQPGEQCDDGNAVAGDGCDQCHRENPGLCGNGVLDPGEQCDDGNNFPFDGCDPLCGGEYCGDGVVQPWEQCDDGNYVSGDGCSAQCAMEESAPGPGGGSD